MKYAAVIEYSQALPRGEDQSRVLLNDYDQVVAVDDLIVGGSGHRFADLLAVQTANALDVGGRKIAQAASEFDFFHV